MSLTRIIPTTLAASLLALAGCDEKSRDPIPVEPTVELDDEIEAAAPSQPRVAIARLVSNDPDFTGAVAFVDNGDRTTIYADLKGLTAGKHGFHIHEKGDCSADDFSSAGGHFNPLDTDHGAPDDAKHHAGDLGNVTATDDERVVVTLSDAGLTLDPTADRSIVDRAVVIHAGADDLESQPSGAAGSRIACGVIQAFEPDQS